SNEYDTQTGAGATTLTELIAEYPSWVDSSAGDYRLTGRIDAPLDRATATPVVPPAGLDLDGLPRAVDADYDGIPEADLGAFEYQFQAPTIALAGPDTVATGQPARFTAAAADPDPGETFGLTPIWSGREDDFSDTPPMGPALTFVWKRPGVKTVRVQVSDPRGRTAAAERQVTVTGPDLNPPPPPPPPPADATAPVLRGVRLAKPGAVRRGKAVRVRLELSEAARVTVVIARRKGGRYKKVRRVRRAVKAGRSTLKVSTKRLKRGRYRLRITAKDAAGNTAAAKTVKVRVR
ncbi:MAG TPA: hypothetical protein VF533_09995, partial [Solirubrobacteraceae bacterium]